MIGKDHRAEHRVLELADVARPAVALEHGKGIRLDAVDALSFLGGEAGNEMADEFRHVVKAIAQRRNPDGEDVEAVVEVLAQAPLPHEINQVLVGRPDQPDIDLDGVLGAELCRLAARAAV